MSLSHISGHVTSHYLLLSFKQFRLIGLSLGYLLLLGDNRGHHDYISTSGLYMVLMWYEVTALQMETRRKHPTNIA